MNTITLYKVVFINEYGDIEDYDFSEEREARTFAQSKNDAIIYRYRILGSIEKI